MAERFRSVSALGLPCRKMALREQPCNVSRPIFNFSTITGHPKRQAIPCLDNIQDDSVQALKSHTQKGSVRWGTHTLVKQFMLKTGLLFGGGFRTGTSIPRFRNSEWHKEGFHSRCGVRQPRRTSRCGEACQTRRFALAPCVPSLPGQYVSCNRTEPPG